MPAMIFILTVKHKPSKYARYTDHARMTASDVLTLMGDVAAGEGGDGHSSRA